MRIEDFSSTVPTADTQLRITEVAAAYRNLVVLIHEQVPGSAHRTDALRKLLESRMTLIHGLTHPA